MHVATAAVAGVNLLDPNSLLADLGALGVFLVLFAETGLLIGFFLPGDSLLFTAGLLCTTTSASGIHLSLPAVLLAGAAGALLGAEVGYLIGRRLGPAMLDRPDRPRLQQAVHRSAAALDRYGTAKAIVLARFIPLVRTVLNPLAGTIRVPVRRFTTWQVVGGLLWSVGVTLAGYLLGKSIPNVDTYLLPIVAVIIAVSLIPVAHELVRNHRGHREPADAAGGSDVPTAADAAVVDDARVAQRTSARGPS
jgi:membrane-associated protein